MPPDAEKKIIWHIQDGLRQYLENSLSEKIFVEGLSHIQKSYPYNSHIQDEIAKAALIVVDKSYNYTHSDRLSHIKYDAPEYNFIDKHTSPRYYSDEPLAELSPGECDMLGIEYIQKRKSFADRGHYSYLRSMLQQIWRQRHGSDQFSIDDRFMYNGQELAKYISDNFDTYEINKGHIAAKQLLETKGRGRPKGARNINKVLPNHTPVVADPIFGDVDLNSGVDSAIPDAPVQPVMQQIEHKPNGSAEHADNSQFVTHTQLAAKNYVRAAVFHEIFNAIVGDIGKIQTWGKNTDEAIIEMAVKIGQIELSKPTIIHLQPVGELPVIDLGVQHRRFPLLLQTVRSKLRNGNRIIPWVYGPAATSKSFSAEMIAKALSLEFHTMGKTLAKFEITGFINTSGYQTTPFRKAYEFGGVFCADEMDAWSNEATTALNNGLANSEFPFPDATIKRHPNFVMICCANTVGHGATMEFVGRNKQDGATLDRFIDIHWPHDDALEDSLVANKDWLTYVRHVRNRVTSAGINPKPMVTMRASLFGESLLNTGIDWADVVDMCLRKGLTETQWAQIK